MEVVEILKKKVEMPDKVYEYEYRLIRGEFIVYHECENIKIQSYGIEVERKDVEDNKVINIERDNIKNISNNKDKVHKLMEILYNNIVSPIHFIEVLGLQVDECVSDFDIII